MRWLIRLQRHTFRQPAKPIEPPTPRTSVLGLDRLASEKRAVAANDKTDESRKRPRQDDGTEIFFKGEYHREPPFQSFHLAV